MGQPQYNDGRRTDSEYQAVVQEFADAYATAPTEVRRLFCAPPPTLLNAARKRADLEWDELSDTRTRWPEFGELQEDYRERFDWDDRKAPVTEQYDGPAEAAWEMYCQRVRARYRSVKTDLAILEDTMEDNAGI